jgi:hypothetical protein
MKRSSIDNIGSVFMGKIKFGTWAVGLVSTTVIVTHMGQNELAYEEIIE